MNAIFIQYRLLLVFVLVVNLCFYGIAQCKYPLRKDVSFNGKVICMQNRFTEYVNRTKNQYLIQARKLSLEGMQLKDKMDNRAAIINYLKAELLLTENVPNSELKSLLLADILHNKGRTYHYVGMGRESFDFVNDSKHINEILTRSRNVEIARFAFFFLATNFDMLEGILRTTGRLGSISCADTAVKIKRDILKIHGAEMGRSYWNYATQFRDLPLPHYGRIDTLIKFSQLAEEEFRLDKKIDRIYNGEFISTNKINLAERYMRHYNNYDSCKFYTEKAIASLSTNNFYKFPNKLPAFLNHEEMMRSSRGISLLLKYLYENTHNKMYIQIAKDILDSAVTTLSLHTAETFIQGCRNIDEMNWTNRFLINALCTGEVFPLKNEKCLDFLSEIEKVKTYNYQKKLLENKMASSQNEGKEIKAIRYLNSQYDNLEQDRLNIKHSNYLLKNLELLVTIDSLEKLNYKKEILNNIFSEKKSEIKNLFTSIKPTTTILLYYLDDFANLCISITSSHIEIYRIPDTNAFSKDLITFKNLNASQTMLDDNWCRLSNKIYRILVEPYLKNSTTSELIVISSGILNTIPFESLITSYAKNNNGKFEITYLMQNMNIRYEYSLKPFYKKELSKQTRSIEKAYAFAPKYEVPSAPSIGTINLPEVNYLKSNLRSESFPLEFNVPEAEMVASSQGGVAFVNDNATEEKFREVACSGDILHLSMHSYSYNDNPMYSGLVFAKNKTRGLIKPTIDNISWIDDGILYAYEISQMNLKSDMVVLSACETGIGRYVTGEGTRSLGLAFRYAGCNNTIMSLWKVDDKYTEELMRSFYTYLREGKPKAEALILAKKDFVKNNETAGPFFWAAFILYGDNCPVHLVRTNQLVQYICYTILFISLLFVIEIYRQKVKAKKYYKV